MTAAAPQLDKSHTAKRERSRKRRSDAVASKVLHASEAIANAVGGRIGTEEKRKTFGRNLVYSLAMVPWGFSLQTARARAMSPFAKVARDARASMVRLANEVYGVDTTDQFWQHQIYVRIEMERRKRELPQMDLDDGIGFLERVEQLAGESAGKAVKRRRGPDNLYEVRVCECIAREYFNAFKRWPGAGRRGRDQTRFSKEVYPKTSARYHHICAAVEQLIDARLSDSARSEGLTRAKQRRQKMSE